MALLFCDSFDHYATADILKKWSSKSENQATIGISAGNGRNGTASLRYNRSNYTSLAALSKSFTALSTIIVGVAFRTSAISDNDRRIISLYDGTNQQVDVRITPAGALKITRAATQLSVSSSALISLDTWYYLEFNVTIANSGTYETRLNGAVVASLTGSGDTYNTGNVSVDTLYLGDAISTSGGMGTTDYDDLYISDTTGSYNKDFLGDVRVVYSPPTANGSNTAWIASAGTDEECIDEVSPNSDTDYIYSVTPADKDSFTHDALGVTGTVKAVQQLSFARKDDSGSRVVRQAMLSGGDYANGANNSLSDSYNYVRDIFETNPDTGLPWDISSVDAAESVVELIS